MQYIIMLAIVLGLALVDFIFGFLKGYVKKNISSQKMRQGGVNKLCEVIIMLTACGLEIGIQALGRYYASGSLETFTRIMGVLAALAVCGYITIMEIVSILENYAEINKNAKWVKRVLRFLKVVENDDKEDK
ncbi:MAG: phage holin family protein [Ruminococcus sp.]|nr:phage holin family protein [Ruminococcus sp.]